MNALKRKNPQVIQKARMSLLMIVSLVLTQAASTLVGSSPVAQAQAPAAEAAAGSPALVNLATSTGSVESRPTAGRSIAIINSLPLDFNKFSPSNGATGVPTSLTLSWGDSSGATGYQYCYDISNPCSNWNSVGTSTSALLSGLDPGTTYYWQVRATNGEGTTDADGGSFWSFTTVDPPGAFGKISPGDGAGGPTNPVLYWGDSSGATDYQYCYDTNNDGSCSTWTSAGTSTSARLSGLDPGTTYYWQVRATNTDGTTYANGNESPFWSFTTISLPGAFNKSSPLDGATGVSTSPTLSWGTSPGADYYETCYSTSSSTCSDWQFNGVSNSAPLSGLAAGTTYYWQVRAGNSSGTTYANGSDADFWSFTTIHNSPGAFSKTSPANNATGISTSPALSWGASTGATDYEYCYGTSASACSSWTSTGPTTSASLSGLAEGTTYYWQVRATNGDSEPTYSNDSSTAFWSFTTFVSPPGAFSKSVPADGATGVSTSPNLSWGASSGADYYEYCYDTSDDNACSNWTSIGPSTSKSLSGLLEGTNYYWQVRAVNSGGITYANGSLAAFWSFATVVSPPGAFNKTGPTNAATGVPTSVDLSWEPSPGATRYQYCYDTSDDDACSNWTNNDTSTSKSLSGLAAGTTYYWHVRAYNGSSAPTYSDGSSTAFWSFTTIVNPPGAFNKTEPADGATSVSTSPTLSWAASAGADSYETCYGTSSSACSSWISTATSTSTSLNGLAEGTTYYWQVRAVNTGGTTYANGGAFSSFTTLVSSPGAFKKSGPANGATGISTSPIFSWGSSPGATKYKYCYDTSNDGDCSHWINAGTSTSKSLSGLSAGTTYYWQVLAINSGGTTYADGSLAAFWSFTTEILPSGAFNKGGPANGATGVPTSPTLSWGTSAGATGYQYCFDTSNDNTCSNWTSNGTSTSKSLSGLIAGTTYYWQVRATNSVGTTYADGSASAFWSFTTANPPGAFNKSGPANGATGAPTSPTLSWGASSGATGYEFCYSLSSGTCSTWTNNGISTSASLSGLSAGTTYYWHVRATNSDGDTYSNGSPTAFWSFTTVASPPGAFNKSGPADGAMDVSTSPTLFWEPSLGASSYQYCYDTSNDDACSSWTSNGAATSKSLSGLSAGTTYYWHVRAFTGSAGPTYSNGSSTAFWSFTTQSGPVQFPGAFSKSSPADGATGVSASPNLSWGTSAGASSYQYCYDTSDDGACSNWMSNGMLTSVDLNGLYAGTTYYWQVRATNNGGTTYSNDGSSGFWSFTTAANPPGAFKKSGPADGATGVSTSSNLSWGTSAGASDYEFCYSLSSGTCSNWISNGRSTIKSLSGLAGETTYYWQVRAVNPFGTTYANGGSSDFWSFTTAAAPPASFKKSGPANGAMLAPTNPTLRWETSSGTDIYAYCYDTTNDNSCASWIANGTATDAKLSGLLPGVTYYWQVKAINSSGTTYADHDGGWSFTTVEDPTTREEFYLPLVIFNSGLPSQ